MSYPTSVQLGIVNIINKIEESQIVGLYKKYPNIFSGKLGKLKDEVLEIIKGRLIINVRGRQIPQFFAQMYEIYG